MHALQDSIPTDTQYTYIILVRIVVRKLTVNMPQEIVLITGTSSGIGLSAAAMLAKHPGQKFKVYAAMRNPAKKDELVKKAEGCADKDLFVIQLDVCSDDSVNAAVKQVLDKEGRIDVLGELWLR